MNSLLPIDVGFDLRLGYLTTMPEGRIRYLDRDGSAQLTEPHERREAVAETLARHGYSLIVYRTANGRDVQCTPKELAPVGAGELGDDDHPIWAVQARRDNYWCRAPNLAAALQLASWRLDELVLPESYD